jgi:hypothetical protein
MTSDISRHENERAGRARAADEHAENARSLSGRRGVHAGTTVAQSSGMTATLTPTLVLTATAFFAVTLCAMIAFALG